MKVFKNSCFRENIWVSKDKTNCAIYYSVRSFEMIRSKIGDPRFEVTAIMVSPMLWWIHSGQEFTSSLNEADPGDLGSLIIIKIYLKEHNLWGHLTWFCGVGTLGAVGGTIHWPSILWFNRVVRLVFLGLIISLFKMLFWRQKTTYYNWQSLIGVKCSNQSPKRICS